MTNEQEAGPRRAERGKRCCQPAKGSAGISSAEPLDGLNRCASVAGLIGVVAAIVAAAAIWLVLTAPVTVATAVDTGEISPLVRQLAAVIYETMAGLLDYL